jgi:predicted transcriptional regulator
MSSVKEMARVLIERLPDTATFDDLMYELYVRQKIEAGLKDAAEGHVLSHEEVVRELLGDQP